MTFQWIRSSRAVSALVGCVAVMALVLATGMAEAKTLRLGHNAAPGNPKDEAAKLFAERVEELSGGDLTISVGGNAQFGDDVEMLTALRLGTLDMSVNSQGPLAGVVPESAVLGLPFLFNDLPSAWQVLDGPVGERLTELAADKGLIVLGYWDNGIRHISNNVRPIETPEDLSGLKIRTPSDPATIDAFEALGANPTPMQFSELYLALEQGVVDGQENPLMNIHSSKLHEVQKFISLSGHKYEMTPVIVAKTTWDTLSEEEREIIRKAEAEAREYQRELSLKADETLRAEIEASGVEFNEVDKAAFQEATAGVIEEWRAEMGDFVGLVEESAAEARDQ